jgi:hypothetical protein
LTDLGFLFFRRGKGDKDVKKEIKKTSASILDFSKKNVLPKNKKIKTSVVENLFKIVMEINLYVAQITSATLKRRFQ